MLFLLQTIDSLLIFAIIQHWTSGENEDETRQNITYVRFRFEPLYKEISMEATRFIMLVFKRAPGYWYHDNIFPNNQRINH